MSLGDFDYSKSYFLPNIWKLQKSWVVSFIVVSYRKLHEQSSFGDMIQFKANFSLNIPHLERPTAILFTANTQIKS